LRKRVYQDGKHVVGLQCLRCGRWAIKPSAAIANPRSLPDYDAGLPERWQALFRERYAQQAAESARQAEQEKKEWWAKYDRYLKTPKWAGKRAKVLARSGGLCESCLENRATEVHHLTYAHVFDEPAFDLRAVCSYCHDRLTARDRENLEMRRRA
jgi:5-methylcytosine-specific restriction endonuclease McrA